MDLRKVDRSLARTQAAIERGLAEGRHIGAQLYVSLERAVVADWAVGEARPGVPMRTDTLMLWLSATKPIVAAAVAQLWQRGLLGLDVPVSRYLPGMAAQGKQNITARHILTHTAGFRMGVSNQSTAPWEEAINRVYAVPLEKGWVPGRTAGYHIATSWFVLGELVRVLDGRPFAQYVREEIFLPLGMQGCWVGMPPEVYRGYGERIGIMHETSGEHPRAHLNWDTESYAALCRPGGGGRGPARELARFYEALLDGGRGVLWPQTVEALTARHRTGLYDLTFKHVMDWGLGFALNSRIYGPGPYGYGPYASRRTFGHGGARSSVAFADPEHQLVVALVFNGTASEAQHQQRLEETTAAIYEDLGLAEVGAK